MMVLIDPTDPRKTILRMPNELLSLIIDNVWDSKSSLYSCSLANKLFSQICRPFVYRKLTVKTERRYEETLQLFDRDPIVCFWVRELYISLRSFRPFSSVDPPPWYTEVFQTLPTKLPNVHTLTLVGCYFIEGFDPSSFLLTFSTWKSVKTLTLKRCQFGPLSLPEFLCCFPTITSFSLHDTSDNQLAGTDRLPTAENSPWSTTGNGPKPPTLYHLSDYSLRLRTPVLTNWLLTTSSRRSLRSLSLRIQYQSGYSTDNLKSFFREIGDRLRYLQLSWAPTIRFAVTQRVNKWIASNLDLSSLTALKSLRLRRPINSHIFPLLMSLPQPHQHPLDNLTLRLHICTLKSFDNEATLSETAIGYKSLDEYLGMGKNYPGLEKVRIIATTGKREGEPDGEKVGKAVEGWFPGTKERVVLCVDVRRAADF